MGLYTFGAFNANNVNIFLRQKCTNSEEGNADIFSPFCHCMEHGEAELQINVFGVFVVLPVNDCGCLGCVNFRLNSFCVFLFHTNNLFTASGFYLDLQGVEPVEAEDAACGPHCVGIQ